MADYLNEVFRIVEGAMRGDAKKVQAYGKMLAAKLEADGQSDSARWLRNILEGNAGAQIKPTDEVNAR